MTLIMMNKEDSVGDIEHLIGKFNCLRFKFFFFCANLYQLRFQLNAWHAHITKTKSRKQK